MQFQLLLVAAAASAVVQAVELTDPSFAGITAGEPFDVTWSGAVGDVTLILLDDTDPNAVTPLATFATGQTGTSFVWTPAETLINLHDYAIQINDAVTSNYGPPFQLLGGVTSTPTSSASSASTSSSASTTASSSSSASSSQSITSSPSSTTSTTSASSTSSSSSSNSTTTSSQSSTSSTASSTSSATGSQTSAPSSANAIASPLALIFLTVAALISLN